MTKNIIVALALFLLLSGCALNVSEVDNVESTEDTELNCFSVYNDYLLSKSDASTEDNKMIGINDIFNIDENYNRYTIFDSNKNGIPELHLSSMKEYIILEFEEDELKIIYSGSGYETLLDNGALLYTRIGSGPEHISYVYTKLDKDNNITQIFFEKYNTMNEEIVDDLFLYENDEISKTEFDENVGNYLSISTEMIIWSDYWNYLVESNNYPASGGTNKK